ncbi:radical SAM family heme chaperone HemW [Peptoniphilus sp. MSJ-1]|uniref:Heme chaperone HemW n=2 Tax=Peptoniphilus ovalis TaxID=2841503 RepID=A0ABS6FID2_9FIRM|nr:radical SAM family heme chaperone HemW [Peptoniphilus ovalis]MBU5669935.1 radical SAM family heme chaperone HemW [Peptoniphilus ovalis]
MMKTNNISIYIHIPFCESRCHYCDFCSSLINRENVGNYFEYLKKEIRLNDEILKNQKIKTIFIGGGTPSSVPSKYIVEIIEILKSYEIADDVEITIESNPNSLSLEKARDYFNVGINRISIGAQSFEDAILREIGRVHKSEEIYKAVRNAREAGFKNINLDLMLALPHQNFSHIKKSIEEIEKLKLEHVSYYSLILEEGTVLYNRCKKDLSSFPDEAEDRKMYHYVVKSLEKLGLKQYEISNFAKDGYECRHNLVYWKLEDYISFGLSASSNLENIRYSNFDSFKEYYKSLDNEVLPISYKEELSKTDRINEYIMMGLRLNYGIDLSEIDNRFDIDFMDDYKDEVSKNLNSGLIKIDDGKLALTEKGRDLSNQVELDFFR